MESSSTTSKKLRSFLLVRSHVDIIARGDDDDPEAAPPVAPEEADGLFVAVVAADDHDQVAADIANLSRLQMLRIVYSGVPPLKVLTEIKRKRQ